MDGDAIELGETAAEAVFEGGGDFVDAGDGEIAIEGAVAGDEDAVLDAADEDVMAIDEAGVFGAERGEMALDGGFETAELLGAGNVDAERLDVDIDVGGGLELAADALLELGGAAMGVAEREALVDFEMEIDEEAAVELLGGDFVDGHVGAAGDGADDVE
jgi:hypothetical protein